MAATIYRVRQFIDPEQLRKDSSINLADLTGAAQDQMSWLIHYGELAAQASRQVDDIKLLVDNAEARADRKIRDEMAAAGEKATEPMIEKRIARNETVIKMKRALNEAKQIEAIGKLAIQVFKDRRDMIIQLGASERKQMEGELQIMKGADRERLQENLKNRMLDLAKAGSE